MKKIVVILPTYNEKENIYEMSQRLFEVRKKITNWDLQVLFSDSHSQDGTLLEVKKASATYPFIHLLDVNKRGIGVGLVMGYQYAFSKLNADAVIQMDADLQHDPDDIPKFINALDKGYDFIQGSRFIKGGENRLQWYRKLFSWGANFVSKTLMGIWNMTEFTASYRCFTREVYERIDFDKIPWKDNSFLFQPAFTYGASKVANKMTEVPIIFIDRRKGYSKMQFVNYIKDLFLFSLKVRIEKSQRFFKFLVVGGIGFIINAVALYFFVEKGKLHPAIANLIAAEISIFSNFVWNNLWTFTDRKITSFKKRILKFLEFNLTSAVGVIFIQTGTIWLGTVIFGKALYPLYFLVGTGFLLIWNFTMYSKVIWKKNE